MKRIYVGILRIGSAVVLSGCNGDSNIATDTVIPTAAISLDDTTITIKKTSTVTIRFSEAVTGVEITDFTTENGTLSNLSTTDNITYTALLTPYINTNDATNTITLSNDYTDLSGNQGAEEISENYTVSTVDLSFYAWNGLTGYDVVSNQISDENLTIYLSRDADFNKNAQILEANGENVWMLISDNPTTDHIDQWIDTIVNYNNSGGNVLGMSLDIEPWTTFADQNDTANRDKWQKYLNLVSYTADALHNHNLSLSVSIPFWTDNINNDVFPNSRPIAYDIIDLADETIIMDYTTNLTNFTTFAQNELSYADSVNKEIKIAIEVVDINDNNVSFYSDPEAMIPFLQTSIDNSSFTGYTIHQMDAFADLTPPIAL